MRAIAFVVVLAGCKQLLTSQDSSDVEGTYVGNATYTIASGGSGRVDAGSAAIDITGDATDGNYAVAIGAACSLSASPIETLTVSDYRDNVHFVFDSEAVDASQTCTLPDGTGLTVAVGDFVVEHGGSISLDVGGPLAGNGSGYVVFEFAGALWMR